MLRSPPVQNYVLDDPHRRLGMVVSVVSSQTDFYIYLEVYVSEQETGGTR